MRNRDIQKHPPFQEQLLALQMLRLEHKPQLVLLQPPVGGVAVGVGAGAGAGVLVVGVGAVGEFELEQLLLLLFHWHSFLHCPLLKPMHVST